MSVSQHDLSTYVTRHAEVLPFSIYQIQTQADSEHPDESRDGMTATFILRHYPKFTIKRLSKKKTNPFVIQNPPTCPPSFGGRRMKDLVGFQYSDVSPDLWSGST